jgi:hypothetical protein
VVLTFAVLQAEQLSRAPKAAEANAATEAATPNPTPWREVSPGT